MRFKKYREATEKEIKEWTKKERESHEYGTFILLDERKEIDSFVNKFLFMEQKSSET